MKIKFKELYIDIIQQKYSHKLAEADNFVFLTIVVEVSWLKAKEYFKKVDEMPAYYTAILLNPTLKD